MKGKNMNGTMNEMMNRAGVACVVALFFGTMLLAIVPMERVRGDDGVGGGGTSIGWTEHTLTSQINGPNGLSIADIDGDGRLDVVAASRYDAYVYWFKAPEDQSQSWQRYTIDTNFRFTEVLDTADIDDDGDIDIVGAAESEDGLVWFQAPSDPTISWSKHTIDNDLMDEANGIGFADLNKDGNLDIISTDEDNGDVMWFEAPDDPTTTWTRHDITNNLAGAFWVYIADIDGDGNLDVVATGRWSKKVNWYESPDDPTGIWIEHNIGSNLGCPQGVVVVDFDKDGDLDVVYTDNEGYVAWFEAPDDPTESWTLYIIDNEIDGALGLGVADIDFDDNLDVVVAGRDSNKVRWYNFDTDPKGSWNVHDVDTNLGYPLHLEIADIDRDNDLDIVVLDHSNDKIIWYENDFYDEDGLVACWHFDEGSGSIVYDSSGNNNHGTIHGASWTTGVSRNALSFDGVNDYVEIPHDDVLEFETEGTYMLWFKPAIQLTPQSPRMDLLHKSGEYGFIFNHHSDMPGIDGGFHPYRVQSSTKYFSAEWYHVTATFNGQCVRIYVNGVLEDSNQAGGTLSHPKENICIGCRPYSYVYFFHGIIDEIRIYNRALTASEIQAHYNEYKPTANNPPSIDITFPSDGATVSGVITITGTASDSDGTVQSVQVKIDSGSWYAASGTTSWSYSWDTTTVSNGAHTIYAKSYDGELYSSIKSVTITVDNPSQYFEFKCEMPTPRSHLTSATLNGKIYAISGFDNTLPYGKNSRLKIVEMYDPVTDSWVRKADTLHGADWSGAVTVNGKIYHMGGGHNFWYFSNNNEYNPDTDTWAAKAPLPVAITNDELVVSNNEKIFVIGGYYYSGGDHWLSTIYIYDPELDSWSQGTNMHSSGGYSIATVLDNKIYVLTSSYFEVYDIATDTWAIKNYPPFEYGAGTDKLTTVEGRIYDIDAWNNEVYLYNPDIDTWAQLDVDIPVKTSAYTVAVLDDSIYIIGGQDGSNHFYSYNVKFKPLTGNQPPTVDITYPSNDATVSGTVVITGTASDNDGTVQNVQIKIDSGSWHTASGTTSWSYSWDTTTVSNGAHTISVRSYDGELYSTVDFISATTNNPAPQKPDLYLNDYDISFSDQNPSVGDDISIYAIIHNWGKMDATATVEFYDGNPETTGNPSELLISSDSISVISGGTDIAFVEWTAEQNGSHQIYVVITNSQPEETTEENNIAYNTITVGGVEQPTLVITLGVSNIAPFEEGKERTIPVTIYCYLMPVSNVRLLILEDENLTITSMTPSIDLNPGDKKDYLIKIKVPKLDENVTLGSKTILVQAVGDDGIMSNAEQIDILIHKPEGGIPGFTAALAIASAGIGALMAFFRRRH
ncbi:MAG TPA: hypothetical protein ENI33_01015 [Thermoplasmatales archaeon]|nr:hypothetical protein [Thermoplasmatales archaeon]